MAVRLAVVVFLSIMGLPGCGGSDCFHFGDPNAVEIVITFEKGTTQKKIEEIVDAIDGKIIAQYPAELVTIRIPSPDQMCESLAFLKRQECVVVAIPNFALDTHGE